MNSLGQIVGQLYGFRGQTRGFVYHPSSGIRDLNLWTEPSPVPGLVHSLNPRNYFQKDWLITSASSINDKGHIQITATSFVGVANGLLLPEPIQHIDDDLVNRILFGVVQDVGGLQLRGKHPEPVGPWGPRELKKDRSHQLTVGLQMLELAQSITDPGARSTAVAVARQTINRALGISNK